MLIEEKVIAYLSGVEGGHPAYAEVPQKPPMRFYLVERTSGTESNLVRSATIAIRCVTYSSLYDAAMMAEGLKEIMAGFTDATENVFSCRLNSMYNYTDTDTKQYRYQAVFDISYQDNWE